MLQKDGSLFKMAWQDILIQRKSLMALMLVFYRHGVSWQSDMSPKAKDAFNQATRAGTMNEGQIKAFFMKDEPLYGNFPEDFYLIFRPPVKDLHAACGISCTWDFREEAPEFGGYLGIWTKNSEEQDEELRALRKPIIFLGYRYETPDKEGTVHKYHHAQPCKSMDKGKRKLPEAVPHSDKLPAFHLRAESPAELLVSLAISVHGRDYCDELIEDLQSLRHPNAPQELIDCLKEWPFDA